jgi:hypothetical protein
MFNPQPKPEKVIKAKKPINKKARKPTGELALFKEIADKVPHVSFISGTRIQELTPSNFHHLLSKGAFPEMRLCRENIVIVTKEEHHLLHGLGKSELVKINPRFAMLFEMAEILKEGLKNE